MLTSSADTPYVIELSVVFEINLNKNACRKFEKYHYLRHDLKSKYRFFKFVNFSISSLGIFGQSCNSFIQIFTDLSIITGHTNYISATDITLR